MAEGKDVVVAKEGGGTELERSELTPHRKGPTKPGHLERGWVKHRLLRDLALAERTTVELGEQYGCSRQAISNFKTRYALEVEEVRNSLADEYAGVWVARKLDRIREYQAAAEKMADGNSPRNAEVLVSILKAVAEELGDLPARQQVQVNTAVVTYQVVAVDLEDLQ